MLDLFVISIMNAFGIALVIRLTGHYHARTQVELESHESNSI